MFLFFKLTVQFWLRSTKAYMKEIFNIRISRWRNIALVTLTSFLSSYSSLSVIKSHVPI